MNILDFAPEIWKLFAAEIGILELKNLVFVNKELFQKVPVLVGTRSMYQYEKLYIKEYYKQHLVERFYKDFYSVHFNGDNKNKFKMLKVLHKDEFICGSINYTNVDFVNRPRNALYKNDINSIGLFFNNCINLPETYSGDISSIGFYDCIVKKTVINRFIGKLYCTFSFLNSTIVLENTVYETSFNGCKFEKDFKIVFTNGCSILNIKDCNGYMPVIEGVVGVENIDNNNFLKIDNKND